MTMPGTYFMNSPMFPPVTSPKLSDATTFFMFSAARCSMIALALPSRSLETSNFASVITLSPTVEVPVR